MTTTVQSETKDVIGTKLATKDIPEESGLEVGTTKQEGRIANLVVYNSTVISKERKGL